jgi:hypothetical protein
MGFMYTEETLRSLSKCYKLGTIDGKNVYPCSYKERFTHPCANSISFLCLYDDGNTLVRRDRENEFAFKKVGVLFANGDVKFCSDDVTYMSPEARDIAAKKTQSTKKAEVKGTMEEESPQPLSVIDELDALMRKILEDVDKCFSI